MINIHVYSQDDLESGNPLGFSKCNLGEERGNQTIEMPVLQINCSTARNETSHLTETPVSPKHSKYTFSGMNKDSNKEVGYVNKEWNPNKPDDARGGMSHQ